MTFFRVSTLLLCAAFTASAAAPLFDFEGPDAADALPYRSRGKTSLDIVPAFATSGTNSLRFSSAAWKPGMPEWPSFELKPTLRDWRGYDRLVIDLTNPSETRFSFVLFVSDSKIPIRNGLHHTFAVPSFGFARCVVPLSAFPDSVNRADIALLHFFTTRPPTGMALHIDSLTLLKKDERLPDPPAAFVRSIAALSHAALDAADRALAGLAQRVAPFCETPAAQRSASNGIERLGAVFRTVRRDLAADTLTMETLDALQSELAVFSNRTERLVDTFRFQQASCRAGFAESPMLVGTASAMEQVLPRDAPFSLTPTRTVELRLARNEKESVQIGVLSADTALRQVRVTASALKGPRGAVLPASQIDCHVTGYVQTRRKPPYAVRHIGWWPDPILDFLGPVDIALGDVQSFWIRVRTPRGQPPGDYRGTLTVSAANAPDVKLDLRVHVYGFTLPDASPLPLAITFAPHDSPIPQSKDAQTAWRKEPDYPINVWKRHTAAWADFLADYFITYDSLYHHGMPDFTILKRLKEQGRLGCFNLGYWYYFNDTPDARKIWENKTLARLRAAYDQAKAHGLLEHAYIYGCDEVAPHSFARVEEAASLIRQACPGVPIMTTTYDHSFGQSSGIRSIDAFCPLTPKYDQAQAALARADGRQVWWYICCGPHAPYANMFIECPAIEGRLLMGAMTAKERPDGFLYYQISIWNSRRPITSEPFTDWDARSWTTYHGDGAWTCVGPDGKPLPTQRLENFRDGLEDYAYVCELESLLRKHASPETSGWTTEARAALHVPEALVTSLKTYSRDPSAVLAWRERLAELIERAPAK
ncbi:MAG TPA: DUF6067 family protein [Kiritimatiellia bacterium]|nr:DUF6067 family protein [Kiritimatiellia bacterium]HRU69535.1 DUF6067 family protein [Kiritimatiellia bacterium]